MKSLRLFVHQILLEFTSKISPQNCATLTKMRCLKKLFKPNKNEANLCFTASQNYSRVFVIFLSYWNQIKLQAYQISWSCFCLNKLFTVYWKGFVHTFFFAEVAIAFWPSDWWIVYWNFDILYQVAEISSQLALIWKIFFFFLLCHFNLNFPHSLENILNTLIRRVFKK